MSLFLDFHDDRLPPGSFQTPVQPPVAKPGAVPLVTVCINQEWIPFILGALSQLTMNTTWAGTDDEIQAARQAANNLILIFQMALPGCQNENPGYAGAEPDYMLRQNPDNPCELQSSVDGVTWCTWADLSKCLPAPVQPGAGTTIPGAGGCETYQGRVTLGSRWLLPVNVNAGDVIKVTNASGTWSSAADLFIPRCPDGNVFFAPSQELPELAGCVDGTGHTESGDPAPTINHDSLIAFDGTNYYDCGPASDGMDVTITIPSGITNASLYFMANTPDTVGFGSVDFSAQYCNNMAATWTHTINFATGLHGWNIVTESGASGPSGQLVAGVGIQTTDYVVAGINVRALQVQITISSTDFTFEEMLYSYTKGNFDNPTGVFAITLAVGTTDVFHDLASVVANVTNADRVAAEAVSAVTSLVLELRTDDTTGSLSGSATLAGLTFKGKGMDPFSAL